MALPPPCEDAPLRLDDLLVRRGYYSTRSRARDAIKRGTVSVAGQPARKAGQPVAPGAAVDVADPARRYVSRAALKLLAGLDRFGLDPAGAVALDIGASTGGFTQVLLERGAAAVTALDVGHGQLDPALAADPRIRLVEGVNARDLTAADLGGALPDLIVCDVSFISLRLALPPALGLARPGCRAGLVKPQFEAGRDAIGKGGMVRAPAAAAAAEALRAWLDGQPGWRALGLAAAPIAGGDGNREFLLGGIKDR